MGIQLTTNDHLKEICLSELLRMQQSLALMRSTYIGIFD